MHRRRILAVAVFEDAALNEAAMKDEARKIGDEVSATEMATIRKMAEERAELLGRVKKALAAGDEQDALKLMREYVGMEEEHRD